MKLDSKDFELIIAIKDFNMEESMMYDYSKVRIMVNGREQNLKSINVIISPDNLQAPMVVKNFEHSKLFYQRGGSPQIFGEEREY